MVEKATFHGVYHYYENVNGKEKKVEKSFTDRKKYDEFMKKHQMPSLGSFFGLPTPPLKSKALPTVKKPIPTKKICKTCVGKKK